MVHVFSWVGDDSRVLGVSSRGDHQRGAHTQTRVFGEGTLVDHGHDRV